MQPVGQHINLLPNNAVYNCAGTVAIVVAGFGHKFGLTWLETASDAVV